MREIKFRAWNGKQIIYPLIPKEGYINVPIVFTDETHPKQPVYMQYTGLKDKNGKEIYVGDILVIDDDGEYFPQEYNEATDEFEPIGHYEIYWSEDGACFWVRGVGKTETPELEYSPWNYASYEVIGNIYENKELLN